jgi:uncharacterized membrane protein YkoI
MTRTTGFAAAGLATMLLAAPVLAQTQTQTPGAAPQGQRTERSEGAERTRASRDTAALNARVSAADAIRAVEAAGFRGVTELEWERGVWEIEAHNAEGGRVKLLVDATTGAVVQKSRR